MDAEELLEDIKRRAKNHAGYWAPSGWDEIIVSCHRDLLAIAPEYLVHQVKEKFGGLRFYAWAPNDLSEEDKDRFHKRIREAEALSYTACQVCGEKGALVVTGYYYETVCQKHRSPGAKDVKLED